MYKISFIWWKISHLLQQQKHGLLCKEHLRDMVRVIKWGNKATNDYFRAVYKPGNNLWLHRTQAVKTVEDGWAMTDPCQFVLGFICFPSARATNHSF
jgi:hypothetical protein